VTTRAAAFLRPNTGSRSLGTIVVPGRAISFSASHRDGFHETDFRVSVHAGKMAERWFPLKDHHLLVRVEKESKDVNGRLEALAAAVRLMGDEVAIRLGLSRPYQPTPQRGPGLCWLMVDGLFSLSDPQS
jgi:hypothetical protein